MNKPNRADYLLTLEGDLQYLTDLENWQSKQHNRPQPNMTTIQIPIADYEKMKADAGRLEFMISNNALIKSDETCCDGYWLEYHKDDSSTYVQVGTYPSPRAAIDAAIKQEGGA